MSRKLPEYAVYLNEREISSLLVRRIGDGEEVGISVEQGMYEFPFKRSAETFINRKNAIELIVALMKYFGIKLTELPSFPPRD